MDGWLVGWLDERMSGLVDEWVDYCGMDGWLVGWIIVGWMLAGW